MLHADRFGNLVLNLPTAAWSPRLPTGVQIRVQVRPGRSMGFGRPGPSRHTARVVTHYAELALNQASAAERFGLGISAEINLEPFVQGR